MITAKIIVSKLKEGLTRFGVHTFQDKGPDEVMDITTISTELKDMTAEQAGNILKEVAESHKHGKALVNCIIQDLDNQPDDWFTTVIDISGAEY